MTTRQLLMLFSGLMMLCLPAARADQLDDDLQTVWESLWDQRGTPRQLARWEKPITYRIYGPDAERHKDHIQKALKAATDIARLQINDVSGQPDAETAAMLDIEVVKDSGLHDNEPCVTSTLKMVNWAYEKVRVSMRSQSTWRCAFHEMMHVMGIAGHPSGKTVLSYFRHRRDVLTDLDQLMLAAWYAPTMPRGATPLEAMVVLSEAVAKQAALGVSPEEATNRAKAFNQRMLQQMEALATGQGEIPTIVLRSGKASQEFMINAQRLAAYYVGLAYMRGVVAEKNEGAAGDWFKRSAQKGFSPAQVMWARALRKGMGIQADPLAAYPWLVLAAKTSNSVARAELADLEKSLSVDELEKARALPAPPMDPL